MIRKEFLQPLVDDRLSTFHMKTTLLFTVERFPENIWRDDNLVQCVINCLTTLKRFLKKCYCPHYTIGSLNLFAEKLKVNEFHLVGDKVTEMIDSGLSCLRTLNMDQVRMRLSRSVAELYHHKILPGAEIHVHIITALIKKIDYSRLNQRDSRLLNSIALPFNSALTTEHEYRAELEFIFYSLCSTLASQNASECFANGSDVTSDIINMYETSLGSNNVSNHLRYASMLVCTH
ncbi:hypothetical protein DPMN_143270 [Dreissena polymorpha]|uniref:Mab-21-like HhH/H2TH-like domain-containing protein n=1 Tax=Dreissena polymorpha TaxID=45954 RepID=A0A9D4JJX5_DREPO|nr:hypothetical protein DPMN_143270 [Dreissena polymorpha]